MISLVSCGGLRAMAMHIHWKNPCLVSGGRLIFFLGEQPHVVVGFQPALGPMHEFGSACVNACGDLLRALSMVGGL